MSAGARAVERQQQSVVKSAVVTSGSGLLAKRRTRSHNSNSSSANSLCYELALLNIPHPEHCGRHCRVITGKTESVRHVQSIERDAASIALICLRRMVMSRLGPEQLEHAREMLQEVEDEAGDCSGSSIDPQAAAGTPQPARPAGGGSGGGTCRTNERLARRLASMADDFGRSRVGMRAVECARGMPLPPSLGRADFDSQLTSMLVDVGSVRCKVTFLMVLCAELAAKAVLECNRAALATLLAWCQELFCGIASALIVMQGWGALLGDDKASWAPFAALVLTLLLIGCTLGRAFRRHCH